MHILVRIFTTALAVALAVWLVPGIDLVGKDNTAKVLTLIAVAVIIGVINAVVKPVTTILTGCLVLLTLGLFLLVINALMLWLASWTAGKLDLGFHVAGFWPAFWGAIVVSIVSGLTYRILAPNDGR